MRKLYYALSVLLAIISIGCDKKDIATYESGHYVYFTTNDEYRNKDVSVDSIVISFFFYLNDDIEYPIEVGLTGRLFSEDTPFKVVVDKEKSDLPEKLYRLPEFFMFRKGRVKDTIYVKLKNDPILKEKAYTLKLDIVEYGNVLTHRGKNARRILKISDIAERPKWWTDNPIVWYYLGDYSRKKYELFMKVTGVSDLTGMDMGKVRLLTLQFQHWLDSQNPKILDEDGNEMSTEIIG